MLVLKKKKFMALHKPTTPNQALKPTINAYKRQPTGARVSVSRSPGATFGALVQNVHLARRLA
jgi:hypothetical protein